MSSEESDGSDSYRIPSDTGSLSSPEAYRRRTSLRSSITTLHDDSYMPNELYDNVGVRRPIDGDFVQFLADYAANDPECPPLLKEYLEDVVLRPGVEELPLKVEYHLRNPRIREYNLGPTFLRALQPYTVYDQLYPRPGAPDLELPNAPIPERYLPGPQLTPGQATDISSALDSPIDLRVIVDSTFHEPEAAEIEVPTSEGAGSEADDEDEMTTSMTSRLHALEGHSRLETAPSAAAAEGTGSASRRRSSQGLFGLRLPGDVSVDDRDEVMDRTGPDWEVESWYKGRRQPPLAARLDTINKFLADEDVDRCMGWEFKFPEIVAYLKWLGDEDDEHQLDHASPQTKAMYRDAVTKAQAHIQFEKHHYKPTPLEFTKPRETPLKSTRLNYLINGQACQPVTKSSDPVPDRSNLLPKPILPRPSSPVNRMPINQPPGQPIYDSFVQDQKTWWQRIRDRNLDNITADANNAERANLVYIEDQSFKSFSRENKIGWVRTDAKTGQTTLPDGTALRPDEPQSWAKERGARRAGLQQALRALPTKPPTQPSAGRRRIIFPVSAAVLRKACESADGLHWTPPSVDLSEVRKDEIETMSTTISYRQRLENIRSLRRLATLQAADGPVRAVLPANLCNGGPFVWRGVDPETQAHQDLLKQCRTALEMLKFAYPRGSRRLLREVLQLATSAEQGAFDDGNVPEQVQLASDEWEESGGKRTPKYLSRSEVEWLQFLAGDGVNSKNWSGRFLPDTPKEKYRLYQLFAKRVQKLLDDRNPDGLLRREGVEVTVEDLLKVINAGKDSSEEVHPYDACCWLDRLKECGHVQFRLDLSCYGAVKRPKVEYFPEHLVRWPLPQERHERPAFPQGFTREWGDVIEKGPVPDTSQGSKIWNFFVALGFRLGYTLSKLSRELADRPPQPVPAKHLRNAIARWQETSARLQGVEDANPTPEELTTIREKIIDELSTNATMLAPGRYVNRFGRRTNYPVRDYNWDWASLAARGETKRRQYWNVNRWPLGVGYLSEKAERAVTNDEDLDPRMTYDPRAADPTTDWRYTRPKLKPYGQDKVKYRAGPAVFPIGDTRLQRDMIAGRMVEMVEEALGLDEVQNSWRHKLARLNPFAPTAGPMDRLPPVDPKLVPTSWDPYGEADRQLAAERRVQEVQDLDEKEETQFTSVDVAMTGMNN